MPIPIASSEFPSLVWGRVHCNFELLRKQRPLGQDILRKLQQQLRIEHTYNSNAIEGNTLTLRETQLVLEQGVTIGGKSLREHLEAISNARAFDWVWEMAKPALKIDHVVVQRLHELVMRGITEWAGRYRTQNVRIGGSRHTPPRPEKIVRLLDAMFSELREHADPIIRSIYLHHRLVFVHPFLDGNGRVARLAANLVLLSEGYPPVVLRASDRKRYYRSLQAADDGDYKPFGGFILRAVDESFAFFLSAVRPARALAPLRELARQTPYSQEYLSLRARQGALEAVKVGRVWYSSREALENYLRTVQRW